MLIEIVGKYKVRFSREAVALFNAQWPASTLRSERAYWFEFDSDANLVDTDCPEQDDGPAASAMAEDALQFYFNDVHPEYLPEEPTEVEETPQRRALREMIRLASCLRSAKNERERKAWRDSLFSFTETARETL